MWHVRTEGVFVRAAVVALETFVLAIGGCDWVAPHTLTLLKASLSELSIARQLLRSSASFSCCEKWYSDGLRSRWHGSDVTVRTSRALICCSNAAARRDVDERTS